MRYWIKLYTEILDDPKMGRLSDREYRTCITLFALAGREDNDGNLPTPVDMAWRLRMDSTELLEDMRALERLNILEEHDGLWMVRKWGERQAKAPSAAPDKVLQRVHEHRERERNETVTTLHPEVKRAVTPPETETETEVETEVETETEKNRKETETETENLSPEFGAAIRAFESEIGIVSGSVAPDMLDMWTMLEMSGVTDWWQGAITIAVSANKRSWQYVRGILANCLQRGTAPAGRSNGTGKPAKKEPKRHLEENAAGQLVAVEDK